MTLKVMVLFYVRFYSPMYSKLNINDLYLIYQMAISILTSFIMLIDYILYRERPQ